MADIHPLPTRRLSGACLRHVTEQSRQAHEAGVDVGSWVPHIHAAADTFRQLAEELRRAVEALLAARPSAGPADRAAEAALRRCIAGAERLAELAAAFPNG
jgi:hypothetical protein